MQSANFYVDVEDYLVIYRIKDREIIILKIGHRKDVYPKVLIRLSKPIKS
jgi:mRNA-degrading endonuclease RelE of RelBE toxin-antitoxin system